MTYTQLEALKRKIVFSDHDCIYIFHYNNEEGESVKLLDSEVEIDKLIRALFRPDLEDIKYIEKSDLSNILLGSNDFKVESL